MLRGSVSITALRRLDSLVTLQRRSHRHGQLIENVTVAYRELCDGYLVKPIQREKLVALLKELDLLTLREDHLTA